MDMTTRRNLSTHLFVATCKLIRVHTCVAGAAETILGASLAYGFEWEPVRTFLTASMVVLLISASNSFNDVVDSAADRIFKPARPIPSGHISRNAALRIAIGCDLAAMAISAYLGFECMMAAAVITLISWLYSVALKGVPSLGNIVVGATSATPVVIGGLATGGVFRSTLIITFGAAVYQIAFEVIKTLRDVDEDAAAGIRTVGSIAPRASAAFASALVTGVVTAVVVAAAISPRPLIYEGIATVGVAAPNAGSIVLLAHSRLPISIRRCLYLMRISWFPGLALLFLLSR